MLPLASLAAPDPAVAGPGPAGLTAVEAARRLAMDGPSELQVWLLLGACVASALLGEVADALAIGAIPVLNAAAIGFFQVGLLHVPATRDLFGLAEVGLRECGVALLVGLIPVSAWELAKLVARMASRLRTPGSPAAAGGRA